MPAARNHQLRPNSRAPRVRRAAGCVLAEHAEGGKGKRHTLLPSKPLEASHAAQMLPPAAMEGRCGPVPGGGREGGVRGVGEAAVRGS